jgi:hypothetical protein
VENIGILTVLVLVLATYRLTRLVTSDTFPFEPLRTRTVGSWFGYLITCPFCVSVWLGGFVAVGQGLIGDTWGWQVFTGAMALSAVVCLLASLAPQSFE